MYNNQMRPLLTSRANGNLIDFYRESSIDKLMLLLISACKTIQMNDSIGNSAKQSVYTRQS